MFLHSQAELALGSRFKAVSESLYAIANETYRASGVAFDAHWFPVLRYLQVKGPASVTGIAAAIGQTHPAVSQLAARLRKAGWVVRRADRSDARRGLLELTAHAERELNRLGPVWCAIRRGAAAAAARSGGSFLDALAAFEGDIASRRLVDDILAERDRLRAAELRIEPYRPELAAHFTRLNIEWLERYFSVEDADRVTLEAPQRNVIERGGAIWFATLDGEVIGTVALLNEAPGVYELSKMAVEAGWRGLGAGRRLLDAAIAHFHRERGRTLFLESNKRLVPALRLYESAGFVHQPSPNPRSHYQRADVYMVYAAPARSAVKRAGTKATKTRKRAKAEA